MFSTFPRERTMSTEGPQLQRLLFDTKELHEHNLSLEEENSRLSALNLKLSRQMTNGILKIQARAMTNPMIQSFLEELFQDEDIKGIYESSKALDELQQLKKTCHVSILQETPNETEGMEITINKTEAMQTEHDPKIEAISQGGTPRCGNQKLTREEDDYWRDHEEFWWE